MNNTAPNFVVTTEYQRFAEFCDACRAYGYIGLCYGAPGVGKTLSARYYANWDRVLAYWLIPDDADRDLAQVAGSETVFYTPEVTNTPRRVEEHIWRLRQSLSSILITELEEQERILLETVGPGNLALRYSLLHDIGADTRLSKELIEAQLTPQEISMIYHARSRELSDPTTLLVIDEADRLKTAALEQVRDIFDQDGLGVVLIGMPGLERRLSRYPQLYSRVGFVHEFRTLSAREVRHVFNQKWVPSGVTVAAEQFVAPEILAALIRITGGNFRLLHRLITQSARLMKINALSKVTQEVVEAAREALVIGTA
ncbi:MAG: hypothetical protein ETSY1_25820 [Candidatus Entotheonella factor]|uniref:ORC1/DEAH AAA+ ATPase domain-containing protein n=1 Tax=Entotheonella factor TaxID=1429438 RepID=W4LFE5_ENTF1|nr:MAG: hypothetical protein ETSY1_25820 [Candidatus Entotheonella factor]